MEENEDVIFYLNDFEIKFSGANEIIKIKLSLFTDWNFNFWDVQALRCWNSTKWMHFAILTLLRFDNETMKLHSKN